MAWRRIDEEIFGTVELSGETRRCRLMERDDAEGLVRLSIIETDAPEGDADEASQPFVLAVSAERFTPDAPTQP